MKTDIGCDTGDIYFSREIPIENEDTSTSVFNKLAILGVECHGTAVIGIGVADKQNLFAVQRIDGCLGESGFCILCGLRRFCLLTCGTPKATDDTENYK